MDWADFLAAHIPEPATIAVEAYTGSGAHGDVFAASVNLAGCVIEDTRRLVRVQTQDAAGKEQVSSTTIYAPPVAVAPPGSRVTLPVAYGSRVTRVLAASVMDAHGHLLPEHIELALE